jgi:hypothetical protein
MTYYRVPMTEILLGVLRVVKVGAAQFTADARQNIVDRVLHYAYELVCCSIFSALIQVRRASIV